VSAHEDIRRELEVKGSTDRAFGFVFTVVFLVISLWPLIQGNLPRWWALVVASVFLILSLARPAILGPLNRLWLRFGLLLGKIMNPIILGIMFFIVITPTAIILRLIGKDLLLMRFESSLKSYWIERKPPGPTADSMSNQF